VTVNDETYRIRKQVIVAYYKQISNFQIGFTEENV